MSANSINQTFPVYLDSSGQPLESGFIYIGLPNQNPETNTKTVYWDKELTTPATQPLRTIGGAISRSGTPAAIYTDGNYSITVKDKNGVLIFTKASPTDLVNTDSFSGEFIFPVDSIADLLLLDTSIYKTVNVRGYYTPNDGGGGIFNYDATQSAVNNSGTILDGWVRQDSEVIDVRYFGAIEPSIGVVQDIPIQKAINYCISEDKILKNDLYKFTTSTLTMPKSLRMERNEPTNIDIDINNISRALFVGDSLTELRTGNSSYVRELIDELADKARGYKEIGYLPMSSFLTKVSDGIQFVKSTNMTYMWGESDGQWNISPYTYSPDGKGVYTTTGDGTDFFNILLTDNLSYEKARIYYLEQPTGGTFTLGFTGTTVLNRVTVNTSGASEVLKTIEIDARPSETYDLRFQNITGKVAIYGVEFLNPSNTLGLNYSVFARSGIKAQDFTELDATSQSLYFTNLAPDVVFINIGTNDAAALTTATTYISYLTTYIGRIIAAVPNAQIILINPNQPDYYYGTSPLLREYDEARRVFAEANGYGYIDIPSIIGGYGEVAAKGGMVDSTHPTTLGKNLIADAVIDFLRFDSIGSNDYYPRDTRGLVFRQDLTEVGAVETLNDGVAKIVKTIGLYGDFSVAYVNLKVQISSYGALVVQDVKFFILKDNTLADGKVSLLREIVITEDLGYLAFTSAVTVTINGSNQVEVTVAPTGFNATSWNVTGYAVGESPKKPNQVIVEI